MHLQGVITKYTTYAAFVIATVLVIVGGMLAGYSVFFLRLSLCVL